MQSLRPPTPGGSGPQLGGSSAPPYSCAPPTCWPVRGATHSTRPPCWVSRRPRSRPRSTPPASWPTSGASTSPTSQRLMSEQPMSSPRSVESGGVPAAGGFRVRGGAVQLHRHRAGTCPPPRRMMGNTVLLKPASTAVLSAHYLIKLLRGGGLPPGVINFVLGSGRAIGDPVLAHPDLGGIHFTGSTAVFHGMWRTIGENIDRYRSTRGSWARPAARTSSSRTRRPIPTRWPRRSSAAASSTRDRSARPCSRVYVPRTCGRRSARGWSGMVAEIAMGDVRDFRNFMGAVIDESSFATHQRPSSAAGRRRTPTSWRAARRTTREG